VYQPAQPVQKGVRLRTLSVALQPQAAAFDPSDGLERNRDFSD
jgi:hypothetical protein